MKNYNWATLGCGVIANELATALKSRGQKLYSVANRTHEKAVAFAEKYGIEKVYNDIDELFKDENVDIIYISTPHNTHIKYLRKALAAGKHVLCEKSITLNSDELDEANYFYPRSPCGERLPCAAALRLYNTDISIHALLAESDRLFPWLLTSILIFLSTLSLRRATCQGQAGFAGYRNFYPRSPCGERPRLFTRIA